LKTEVITKVMRLYLKEKYTLLKVAEIQDALIIKGILNQ